MTQYLILYVVSVSVRSIAVAAIAGMVSWKLRSVAIRHAVWVVVLGTMLLLPVLDAVLPSSWVPARLQHRVVTESLKFTRVVVTGNPSMPVLPVPVASPISPVSSPRNWWNVAFVLYLFVVLAMLSRLVLGYRRIWILKRSSHPVASAVWATIVGEHRIHWRTPELRESDRVKVPLTVGFSTPAVILPADWKSWDDWKLQAVLSHEYAHVHRADWAIAAVAAVVKCAYWMNPLSWFLQKHLSELAEHASDDASLIRTGNPARYAELLLEFATAAQNGGRFMTRGVAMAHHRVESRIERVLSNSSVSAGILRLAGWLLLATLAVPVLYSAAALQVASRPVPLKFAATVTPQVSASASVSQVMVSGPESTKIAASSQDLQSARLRKPIEIAAIADPTPLVTGGGQDNSSEEPRNSVYVIKANDELSVLVYNHPELSLTATVQPDGSITTPLVQRIQAAGLSLEQLKVAIEKRLTDVITMPNVSIALKVANERVFVIGKVLKPGIINYSKPITVLQAVALAGGFQENAKRDEIYILRREMRFTFNYDEVVSRGDVLHQNIYLESGDVVTVPYEINRVWQ